MWGYGISPPCLVECHFAVSLTSASFRASCGGNDSVCTRVEPGGPKRGRLRAVELPGGGSPPCSLRATCFMVHQVSQTFSSIKAKKP